MDGANRHDMKLVRATVDSVPVPRPEPSPDHPQGMCLDKGYDFDEVRRTLEEFGFTAHIRVRWDKYPENYIAFLHFACALVALRAAGLLG